MKWLSPIIALLVTLPLGAEPVLVGKFPAKIVPEQLSVLPLPERGIITDLASEGHLKAGEVIAILNKERTAQEREDMEFQLAKDRIARRDDLRQLRQQRDKLLFYLNLSENERKYAVDAAKDGEPPTRESLRDIDERIALAEREIETMERRKRDEFERNHEQQTLRMPFDGRLQYNITLPEDRSAPFEIVGAVQTFASVCDDSAYYVTIGISHSDLSLLPENKLSVRVPLPEGRELVGHYAFRRVERARSGPGDMLVYFFRLPAEDSETAYGMLGSNTTASLFYEVEGNVERVGKARLATHPEASRCENWSELVGRAYPGAVVVFVADRDVVIRHPSAQEQEAAATAEPTTTPASTPTATHAATPVSTPVSTPAAIPVSTPASIPATGTRHRHLETPEYEAYL